MSRTDDDRHRGPNGPGDEDAEVRAAIEDVRRELRATRQPMPDDAAFERQANDIMAQLAARGAEAAPATDESHAAANQRSSWLSRLRDWWEDATRIEIAAWAGAAALVVAGLAIVIVQVLDSSPADPAPAPAPGDPEIATDRDDVPTHTPDGDILDEPDKTDEPDDSAIAAIETDETYDPVFGDESVTEVYVASADATTLRSLDELSTDDFVPPTRDEGGSRWAALARDDHSSLGALDALDTEELVALDAALDGDGILSPTGRR